MKRTCSKNVIDGQIYQNPFVLQETNSFPNTKYKLKYNNSVQTSFYENIIASPSLQTLLFSIYIIMKMVS